MDVTVVPHESSRQDFRDWEARILAMPGGSRAMYNLLVREMREELVKKEGVPDSAERLMNTLPPLYEWHFRMMFGSDTPTKMSRVT